MHWRYSVQNDRNIIPPSALLISYCFSAAANDSDAAAVAATEYTVPRRKNDDRSTNTKPENENAERQLLTEPAIESSDIDSVWSHSKNAAALDLFVAFRAAANELLFWATASNEKLRFDKIRRPEAASWSP